MALNLCLCCLSVFTLLQIHFQYYFGAFFLQLPLVLYRWYPHFRLCSPNQFSLADATLQTGRFCSSKRIGLHNSKDYLVDCIWSVGKVHSVQKMYDPICPHLYQIALLGTDELPLESHLILKHFVERQCSISHCGLRSVIKNRNK